MPVVDITELERAARRKVDAVADDPAGRVRLRRDFYRNYGFGDRQEIPTVYGFGSSELAFFQWEVDRGVLNPINGSATPGSSWWRNVNLDFLFYSELGALAYESGANAAMLPVAARAWMDYIATPNSKSWYRAHNTSIVSGYLGRLSDALSERRAEQCFMNVVLYRLLYAQGLVEGVEMGRLGTLLANPELPSVDVMVHLPDFYPRHYPLSAQDVRHVMHKAHSLEELTVILLDDICIMPQLTSLYSQASKWADSPELPTYLIDGEPVYPTRIPRPWHVILRHRLTLLLLLLWRRLLGK
ncbi:MAG TPA: hypothetical protein VGQ52_00595 [Gemmatimonadaceae bacterium]|nr:hypothetical protein [Gemmatimonadaceae bacterium]